MIYRILTWWRKRHFPPHIRKLWRDAEVARIKHQKGPDVKKAVHELLKEELK